MLQMFLSAPTTEASLAIILRLNAFWSTQTEVFHTG